MYIPEEFEWQDRAAVIAFMRAYNFATVITSKDNIPRATHLPFHLEEQGDDLVLTAHFARNNPQWQELDAVLVVFQGPHAYISPSHYERQQNVPTWNYLAVHAYGKGMIVEDKEEGMQVLEDMMRQSEPAYLAQWATLDADYKGRLFKGIVPFRIKIERLQAKHKMSQNKTQQEQQRIVDTLSARENSAERELAAYMAGKK